MNSTLWCIGKNYALHAKELGGTLEKEPVVFLKSSHCIVKPQGRIQLPSFSHDVQYEVELAFLLDDSLNFSHVTTALDLTARDVQTNCKEKGLPWTLAKSFKQSCPLGTWEKLSNFENLEFSLHVNGKLRQKGSSKEMIFSLDQIHSYLLQHFPIASGDIVLTGTPEGVSTIKSGDKAEVFLGDSSKGFWTFL